MNVVISIDSFKGSLSSLEAGKAAAEGIRRVYPDASIHIRPLADGGEGTVEAVISGCGGSMEQVPVKDPLGRPVLCSYGILGENQTAIIEMAGASGITLLNENERNPFFTTTYGVGEVILHAVKKGCRHFIIGIGGSATNDGGIGMLQALGFDLLTKDMEQVSPGAEGLSQLALISNEHVLPVLKECTFRIACDVTNPLCGSMGCSTVFGPQKGASEELIQQMDLWLSKYAVLASKLYPDADPDYPGCGAAGGLGFAFKTFLNASLESGIKIVLDETNLENYIKDADFVITGEGRLDGQTVMGKAPIGVAEIAKKYNKRVFAFSGSVTPDASTCNQYGIDAFFPILRQVVTLEQAMNPKMARTNMAATTEQVFRAIKSAMDN